MSRARTAFLALVSGVAFAVIIGVVNYFSSGLHVGRVVLAGALFSVLTYFIWRRREARRGREGPRRERA